MTVTFSPRQIRTPVNILILDDEIVEKDEYFNLTIDPSSLPSDVSLGDSSQAVVTIVDDDSE